MTWDAPIDKAPSGDPEPWLTNERILSEWNRHVSKRGAKTTQRNHRVYVAAFARMFTELLTALEREDIDYVRGIYFEIAQSRGDFRYQ